jgi:uncharacterized protein involved in type VI secretion and phage assembly
VTGVQLVVAPEITVGGRPLADANSLVRLRVERGLCVISRATLCFNDPGYRLSAGSTFRLGADLSVAVEGKKIFSGRVTGVSLEQNTAESVDFIVVADDHGCMLGRSMAPKTYLNSTYEDAIKKIAQEAGLTVKASGQALRAANEYLLRTGSGLDWIDQVTRRTGTVWWVQEKELHVAEAGTSSGSVRLGLGEELTEFSVRASALRPTGSRVSGWDQSQQSQILGTGQAGSGASSEFVSDYTRSGADKLGDSTASTAQLFPATADEATAIASALLDDVKAGSVVARGRCWATAAIAPGVTVEVAAAGPSSGKYLVSEVEHLYTSRGFHTRFVAGPRRPAGLADTLGRPPADPGLRIDGLVIGKVSDIADPDNHGRVKVKFIAFDGQIDSAWARVVAIGAGAQRGFVIQPEINDEVLVGFEYGDSRRPVVIGGLFSPKNDLPEAGKLVANGKVEYRRITSRKNHVIEIADGEGPATQHILLLLGTAQHKLRLGADAFDVEVASGKPVTIKAGTAKFEISGSGDVTIEGNNVTIKAKQNFKAEGMAGAAVTSNAQTQLEGTTVAVKAKASADVEGTGMLNLKGGMVKIN